VAALEAGAGSLIDQPKTRLATAAAAKAIPANTNGRVNMDNSVTPGALGLLGNACRPATAAFVGLGTGSPGKRYNSVFLPDLLVAIIDQSLSVKLEGTTFGFERG
jgi:hypothetical protein